MTIIEPSVLSFSVVTKHYAYPRSGFDGDSAEISGDWHIEALRLCLCDSREIEICMAFSVQIYI
ncbi:hypothetical protein PS928_06177 [Pseudomonas fluorescens]|uniref:Uncharacterized protein n=1 Tax=Pseudomonas fluorescens TaxID=294 RepID=A0A5E7VSF0_PSEFL|nr:hypothetical protein PS928_06177 [Pseudomonas fluorescens]